LFGYISYDAVRYFEKWPLLKNNSISIPDVYYAYTKHHCNQSFKNEAIFCHSLDGKNNISEIELLQSRNIASYKFSKKARLFKLTDEEFKHNVALAKTLFQMFCWSYLVHQGFKGDEVWALKHQPFPLFILFFFYGDFKMFFTWSTNYCKDRSRNPSYCRNF
jgi:anthranilate synthase component 1